MNKLSLKNIYIHVGFYKTGHTFLQNIVFPNFKNLIFLNKPNISPIFSQNINKIEKNQIYNDLFKNFEDNSSVLLSRGSLTGSLLTGDPYLSHHNAKKLKKIFPNAKIILCIREQKNWILSQYSYLVRRARTWRNLDSFLVKYFDQFINERLKYDELINLYYTLYGRKNVLVLVFEELTKEPDNFLNGIKKFIEFDLDEMGIDMRRSINKNNSKSIIFNKSMRFVNFMINGMFYCIRKTGSLNNEEISQIRYKMMKYYSPYLSKKLGTIGNNLKISAKWEGIIDETYSKSNKNTAILIQRDLKDLGWITE